MLDELLDKPCPIHSVLLNTNPTHSLRACWVVRQVAKSGESILEYHPPQKFINTTGKMRGNPDDLRDVFLKESKETSPSRARSNPPGDRLKFMGRHTNHFRTTGHAKVRLEPMSARPSPPPHCTWVSTPQGPNARRQ